MLGRISNSCLFFLWGLVALRCHRGVVADGEESNETFRLRGITLPVNNNKVLEEEQDKANDDSDRALQVALDHMRHSGCIYTKNCDATVGNSLVIGECNWQERGACGLDMQPLFEEEIGNGM